MKGRDALMPNDYTLQKGKQLYAAGDKLEGLFLVKSGTVGLYAADDHGEVVVEIIRKGGFLEVERILGDAPVLFSSKAMEDAVLSYIHFNELDQFVSANPLKAMDLLTYLSDELEHLNNKLIMGSGGKYAEDSRVEIIKNNDDYLINSDRQYMKQLPEEHRQYLLSREVVCPVCERSFEVNSIKASKLEFERLDDDFRKHFYDIDELWYQIWRCPYCHYAHFSNEFHRINNLVRAELKVSLPRYEQPKHQVLIKENYQQVFEEIYTMNRLLDQITKSSFVKARLWQSYAWLLADVGDEETAKEARRVVKAYYEDAWFNGTMVLDPNDEVKLAIKIAMLCREFGEIREAKNYLFKVIQMRPSHKVLLQKAQDMLYDLKHST